MFAFNILHLFLDQEQHEYMACTHLVFSAYWDDAFQKD